MNNIKLFEDRKIRSHYDEENENPRNYWSVLKTRLKNEGSEMATNCSQLKCHYKSSLSPFFSIFSLLFGRI